MSEVVIYLNDKLSKFNLLEAMRRQLEKDFYSATFIEVSFDGVTVEELVNQVHQEINRIVSTDVSKFSNLLYRVDVSEASVDALKGLPVEEYWEQLTFLILKREWQKVWIRNTL